MGCGARDFGPDWVHIDGGDYPHLNSKDITKLPYDDNTVDLIYASHVLEYFSREEVNGVLQEWFRVLKKGGILRLAVPDFESMANLYVKKEMNLRYFLGPMYGRMKMGDVFIYHKTTYDLDNLTDVLSEAGFTSINEYDWRDYEVHVNHDDHSQAYIPHMDKENGVLISLNVEATK